MEGRQLLPIIAGRPIKVEVRRSFGPHLAATSIPQRVIKLDSEVLKTRGDFERILVHELFHFVWVRLSNATRRSWEEIVGAELMSKAQGELGWSSEWRKLKLTSQDRRLRTPKWRRYCCESFCDSAAFLYAGLRRHDEFTLPPRDRQERQRWFKQNLQQGRVPL